MKRRELLVQAIVAAQHLNSDGRNAEYVRGQAELICDLFDLPEENSRQDVIELITHGRPHPHTYISGQSVEVRVSGADATSQPAVVVADLGRHVSVQLNNGDVVSLLRSNVSGAGTRIEGAGRAQR